MAANESTPPKPLVLGNRLVAFIDFLGFRSVLQDADKQVAILETLREAADQDRNFEVQTEVISERETAISISPAVTSFSDNVLISFDIDKLPPAGAWHALMLIRGTACALAHRARQFDCLIRGAVTIGPLYHEDRVAVGGGLVDAYTLESTCAVYPRIIVAPQVFDLFHPFASANGESTDDRSMFRDADGYWCLDYLTAYIEEIDRQYGSAPTAAGCDARRAWALTKRADALERANQFALAHKSRAAQNWAWYASRIEKYMNSINPHRFNMD